MEEELFDCLQGVKRDNHTQMLLVVEMQLPSDCLFFGLSVQWIGLGFSGALLFSGSTGPHSRGGILDG